MDSNVSLTGQKSVLEDID